MRYTFHLTAVSSPEDTTESRTGDTVMHAAQRDEHINNRGAGRCFDLGGIDSMVEYCTAITITNTTINGNVKGRGEGDSAPTAPVVLTPVNKTKE